MNQIRIISVFLVIIILLFCVACKNGSNKITVDKEKENVVSESPLSNTYQLLTTKKRLTIGYLGGSITLGSSATKQGGSIDKSWVNLTGAWFKENFPDAYIENVNAGVSDTATNFGIFRLDKCLMDENLNDIPDLVFVEFTSNDWIYATQTEEDLKLQIESLFLNIWKYNPYAEIVVIVSARSEDIPSRQAYLSVANYYNIPVIDVGIAMQKKIDERGNSQEAEGSYYYTADNLHPTWRGYEVYFNEIKGNLLEKYLLNPQIKGKTLYPYGEKLPKALNKKLITSPKILTSEKLTLGKGTEIVEASLNCDMYGTIDSVYGVAVTGTYINIEDRTTVKAKFKGTALGILFRMNSVGIKMSYSIDGGEEKIFRVDEKNFGFQMYDHSQVFMLEHNLSKKEHTVEIEFIPLDGVDYVNVTLGGLLVNG